MINRMQRNNTFDIMTSSMLTSYSPLILVRSSFASSVNTNTPPYFELLADWANSLTLAKVSSTKISWESPGQYLSKIPLQAHSLDR